MCVYLFTYVSDLIYCSIFLVMHIQPGILGDVLLKNDRGLHAYKL